MATYFITGASRGVGLELTKQLLELPADQVSLVLANSRSEPSAALASLIASSSGRVKNIVAAVDNTASVEEAARQVEALLGPEKGLDVLVNNAGILGERYPGPGGKLERCPPEEIEGILNTNVVGSHRVIRAFLPLLRKGGQKKIINISSTMGAFSWAEKLHPMHLQAYKISKAALNMLTKITSMDLADEGFTVLAVSPGYLKTDMGGEGADLPVSVGTAEVKRMILEATPAWNGKFLNIRVPGMEDSWGKYDGGEISW